MPGISGQPGPKPSEVENPVPGDSALDSFMASQGQAAKAAGSAAANIPANGSGGPQSAPGGSSLDSFMAQQGGGQAPPQEQSTTGKVLDAAGRVLDYGGGLVRTGLASAAGLASGDPNVATTDDLVQALKGKAPNSAEYLKRLGVPEGGSIGVPLLGQVSMRGAAGFAADIATDPLTLVARTVKEIPYLSKLLNAPGAASDAIGQAVYKSALPTEAAGEALIEAGGAPVGSAAKLAEKVQDVSQTLGGIRQGLYDRANQVGAVVNMAEQELPKTNAVLLKMYRDPMLAPLAFIFDDMVNKYKQLGPCPLSLVSEWKTNLFNSLPEMEDSTLKNISQQFKAALAMDFKNAVVSAGESAEKGLGNAIEDMNTKWGTLLDAPPLKPGGMATGGTGKLGVAIDGATLALGGVKGLAIKKSAELATSPYMKTLIGKSLMQAGTSGLATGVTNRALIDSQNSPGQDSQ